MSLCACAPNPAKETAAAKAHAQLKSHTASCSTIALATMQHPILGEHMHEAYKSPFIGLGKYFRNAIQNPRPEKGETKQLCLTCVSEHGPVHV